MKNIITKIAILILAFTGITLDSYGQCTNTSLYPSAFTAPGTIGSPYTISGCQYRSEYNQMNGVVAGSNFTSTFATAGTYITIRYGAYNGTVVATGTTPLTWTATAGSGSYFIHYNVNSSCATDAPCVSSAITLNSGGGGGGGCTYLVPSSGNNSITASSGTICDHAGTSNYSNSVSGYTVINPVSGAAVLTFSSFALECCCDYVYVYNGAGIGGTLLWSGNCTTLPPVITSTSGPLTIQFTSDVSVTNTGFSATISNVPLSPCASVTNISGPCVSTTTSVTGSGVYDPVSTSCGFSTPGQEKIFTFTPPATGTYTINQTTSIGYVDWFFKASSGGCSGTGWTCIDDVYNNFSSVGFTLTGGTQYYLMLDPETTTAGSLSFTVSPPVPSAPTPVTASPTTINCPGASVNLNATSAGNTIRWYTVPTGGTNIGTSASAANFGVTPAATTTYYAEAYNAACNLTSASRTAVTVTLSQPAPTSVTATPSTLCGSGTVQLNATNTGGTISWYTVPTGGTAIGASASAANFAVTPAATTTYYAASVWGGGGPGSQTFNYTGGVQTFTVPAGVTSISFDARGAKGGYGSPASHQGGNGGRVQGTLSVTPGQVLNIYVGGVGANGTPTVAGSGGYNGGAQGALYSGSYSGGGGGGASDIRFSPYALANREVVAGGGGGGAYNYTSTDYDRGGPGGGLSGSGGYSGNTLLGGGYPGGGGTQSTGGTMGVYTGYCNGTAGALGIGGAGGTCTNSGGGGGGGYYGGGGGVWGGGGGGSSYTSGLVGSVTHTQGFQTGNGQVVLSWTGGVPCEGPTRTAVTVTVHTLPGITCPSTQTLSLGGSCSASLPDYTSMATTTGSATPLTVTQSPVAGTTVTGNTTVTLTVTDACNNTATCNFAVNTIYTPSNLTLTADCSSPMSVSGTIGCIDNCNLRIGADKQVEVTIPAAGDWTFSLCGGGVWDSYIYLSASACGTSLYSDDDGCGGIGLSTLTYSIPSAGVYYIDVEGFAGASPGTPFTLTVTNATPAPSITCPAAQTLTLDGSCGGNLGDYTSMATTSGGNGTLTVTQSPASGTMVSGVGATTITLTATDACMRTATCSFSVNRVDNTAPATPSLSPVMGQCSAMAIAPTTTDACAGTITGTTVDPTSYTSQGTYMITWTFADGNGNSTSATQTVVVDDTNGPVPDMGSLSTVTANCGVTLTAPTATDACAGAITGTTGMTTYTSPGTYTVTWTYDDGNGNTTNQNQTVIVTAGSVTASSNTPICTGADVMLSAMGSSAGTYSWTGPNGFNSTTQNPSITGAQPNASGTYTVTWESSAYPGCTATNSTNVFVGPISLAVTPDPIDSTLAHAVISNCASPYTLFWRTLIAPTWSSMSSMANNPDITGLQPATAYVAYAVDANGATTGMVYFTTSGTSFCGLAPTLTALVNCDKIFVDWSGGVLYPQYSINSRKVSPTLTPLAGYYTAATSQVFTITPANFNATYEVSVAGMCDNQYSIRSAPSYVTVLDPRPGQPTGLTFTATCNSITTNWAAVAGAVGYFVKIKNPATGTITANIYTTNLTATKTGLSAGPVGTGYLYEVWVTPVGCSNLLGTPSQHYLVQTCTGNATPVGPRLQSPDPETLYASEMDNDTEAIMDIAMLVYPNPNHGAFTVSANLADASALVEVVNMLGQVVYTQKVALENGILNHEIKLSEGNTPGTYLVRVTSQSGNYVTKFVKM